LEPGCPFTTTNDLVGATQLQRHYQTTHPVVGVATIKVPSLPTLRLTGQINNDRFQAFKVEWDHYKMATNLCPETYTNFLVSCLDDGLKKEILSVVPNVIAKTEAEVLTI
jgi:hypothetical protein